MLIIANSSDVNMAFTFPKITARVAMVTGYQRTGKDHLYQQLVSTASTSSALSVYKHPQSSRPMKFPTFNNLQRVAFADELKIEVAQRYGVTVNDDMKDIKIIDYANDECKSARDLYNEWGQMRRRQNPNYWIQMVVSQVRAHGDYMITDWRFPNEQEYLAARYTDIITIRVFRSDVPIPAASIVSEHGLDNWCTEYLIVPESLCEVEFLAAVRQFPCYKDYVLCDSI